MVEQGKRKGVKCRVLKLKEVLAMTCWTRLNAIYIHILGLILEYTYNQKSRHTVTHNPFSYIIFTVYIDCDISIYLKYTSVIVSCMQLYMIVICMHGFTIPTL